MRRIDLYIDNNDRVVLNMLKNVNYKCESLVLKGNDAYEYIQKLSRNRIRDIREDNSGINATLVYDDFVININNYTRLLSKRGLEPIRNNIKLYIEKKELENLKNKKVKRKNKYSNKRIAALGLALIVIGGCAFTQKVQSKASDNKKSTSITYLNTTNDTDLSNIEINDNGNIKKISIDYATQINIDESKNIEDISKEVTSIENIDNIILNNDEDSNEMSVFIDYTDRSTTEKAYKTQSNYGNIIKKYADVYGHDYRLVTAIATQERGVHSPTMDIGGATGLMQIQNSVWVGEKVSAYNFETNSIETITVSLNDLSNVETNIKIGCMILQNAMQYMDYNILAGIQCYNMGYGNMKKILNECARANNKTVKEVLSDMTNNDWLDYRYLITMGDQSYVENVLSWIGSEINIQEIKSDGTNINLDISNQNIEKKVY